MAKKSHSLVLWPGECPLKRQAPWEGSHHCMRLPVLHVPPLLAGFVPGSLIARCVLRRTTIKAVDGEKRMHASNRGMVFANSSSLPTTATHVLLEPAHAGEKFLKTKRSSQFHVKAA